MLLGEAQNKQYKMLRQLNDFKKYDPINAEKINYRKETLIKRNCMITEILSLRHFETVFCCLKTDFKKRVRYVP